MVPRAKIHEWNLGPSALLSMFVYMCVCVCVYIYLALMGLCCFVWSFSSCREQGLFFTAVSPLVLETGSRLRGVQ